MTKEQITGGETADLTMLLDRNRSFAEKFTAGDLKISPRMSTILLTCLDARVDPAHLFGLGLGDALVIRNAGGRITPGGDGRSRHTRRSGRRLQPARNQPKATGTCHCPPHRLRHVSSRQAGHSGTSGRTGSASVSTKYRQWRSATLPRPCKTTSNDSVTPPERQTNWSSPDSSTT